MGNQRFESTPIFKVDEDPVIIQAAAGSSANLLVLKASDGSTLSSISTTGAVTAPTATAGTNTTQVATTEFVQTAIANLVDSAPAALNTLDELAAALGDDANFATTVTNTLADKAPSNNPTFTGIVSLPADTSIGNVSSTELAYLDGVTSGVQSQLNAKAPTASPTFTGTVTLPSDTSVGTVSSAEIGYLDGVTSAIQTQIDAKAPIASPTFTGTVVAPKSSVGTLGGRYNAGMSNGSIELGNTAADLAYTSGTWPGVMGAGVLQNCSDRFEHIIHDGGTRLASSMYYDGPDNAIVVGRDVGWGTTILKNPGLPAMRAYCGYVDGHAAISGSGVFTATNIPLNNRSCMPTSGTGAYQNFYAPVDGYYHASFHWTILGHTAGYYYGAYFQIDGATPDGAYASYFKPPTTGNDDGCAISATFYLSKNQYIRVAVNNQSSVRFQIAKFSVHLVG